MKKNIFIIVLTFLSTIALGQNSTKKLEWDKTFMPTQNCDLLQHGNYELVFFDDFNTPTIDTTIWYTCVDGWQRTHGDQGKELQYYLDNNVSIRNGILSLTARRQPDLYLVKRFVSGQYQETYEYYEYTSGWIQTKSLVQYGRIEARCRIPYGIKLWPAFWLFGNTNEIDIFEFCGDSVNEIKTDIHLWTEDNHEHDHSKYDSHTQLSDDFHIYALEWDEYKISFMVDGLVFRTIYHYCDMLGRVISDCSHHIGGYYLVNPLYPTHPQSIILNLAISGSLPDCFCDKGLIDNNIFPASMDIDYVKVYKQRNDRLSLDINEYANSSTSFYCGKSISVAENSPVTIGNNQFFYINAKDSIVFKPGFHACRGSVVSASIYQDERASSDFGKNTNNVKKDNSVEMDSLYLNSNNPIECYPNPSTGDFVLKVNIPTDGFVDIYNLQGVRIFHFEDFTFGTQKVNMSMYPKGSYLIVTTINDTPVYSKIVII